MGTGRPWQRKQKPNIESCSQETSATLSYTHRVHIGQLSITAKKYRRESLILRERDETAPCGVNAATWRSYCNAEVAVLDAVTAQGKNLSTIIRESGCLRDGSDTALQTVAHRTIRVFLAARGIDWKTLDDRTYQAAFRIQLGRVRQCVGGTSASQAATRVPTAVAVTSFLCRHKKGIGAQGSESGRSRRCGKSGRRLTGNQLWSHWRCGRSGRRRRPLCCWCPWLDGYCLSRGSVRIRRRAAFARP